MRILNGGKKDYYDYISGIYGIDEDVTYDRKNGYICKEFKTDKEYFAPSVQLVDSSNGAQWPQHLIVESGYCQYLFKILMCFNNNIWDVTPTFIEKIQVSEKKSKYPLSIIPVSYHAWWNEPECRIRHYFMESEIPNPILKNTFIPSFINAEEMYNNIYDYLISIREPKIEDTRNDIQKLESKGFDKKTSFRNPVNKPNKNKFLQKKNK